MNKSIISKSQLSVFAPLLASLILAAGIQTASAQEYKKVKRLGTSQAVCPGGIETAAQLQQFFADNPDAIKGILADSGWSGSADDLMAAVANGDFAEGSYPVGTRFAWMGLKKDGQYVAAPYREWAGSKSIDAFQVNVSSGCQVYQIGIPKICCNVSLIGVTADTSEACQPVAVAAVAEPAPAPVVKKALRLIPFIGAFLGTETRPRFETAWQMDMRDSSGLSGIRAGLIKELSSRTSVFGQVSYYDRNGVNGGNVYPDDNFAIDVGMERRLGERAFIGGGIGIWNVDDSDFNDASIFGHVGGDIGTSNLQWFLEGRFFDSDSPNHDSLSDNRMFSAGVRYLIK